MSHDDKNSELFRARLCMEGRTGIDFMEGFNKFLEGRAACTKCGKTPPFPGGTRCQNLQCPLIEWASSAIAPPFKLPLRAEHIPYEGTWFYDPDGNDVEHEVIADFINKNFGPTDGKGQP